MYRLGTIVRPLRYSRLRGALRLLALQEACGKFATFVKEGAEREDPEEHWSLRVGMATGAANDTLNAIAVAEILIP